MSRYRNRHRRNNKGRKLIIALIIILTCTIIGYFTYPYYQPFLAQQYERFFVKSKTPATPIDTYREMYPQYTIYGIDVSHYQGLINWSTLTANNKIDFAIARATYGKNGKDAYYVYNHKVLHDKEIPMGAYHYYRPNEQSKAQAEAYIKTVTLEDGDLPPILDIEKRTKEQSTNSLKEGILNWLNIVEEHYRATPIIYTYFSFYNSVFKNDQRFDKYSFWIANYNTDSKKVKTIENAKFWQFTESGSIPGINTNVDLNVFLGTRSEFNKIRVQTK